MPKVTGQKRVIDRLEFLISPEARGQIGKALVAGGERVEAEAAISMTRNRAEVVDKSRHVPSRPGEPPAVLYGDLRRSLETVQKSDVLVEVSANDEKAALLEYGTSRMAERPFMRPALEAEREEITKLVRKAVEHIAKGGRLR